MKKTVLTTFLAASCALCFAQPPQGVRPDGGKPPVMQCGDSLQPLKNLFGPLTKRIQLHGYVQAGYEWNNKMEKQTNTFNMKRTGLVAMAQVTDRWDFFFFYDCMTEVQDFYTNFRITNNKALNFRFGQMKNSLSLENQYSPANQEIIEVTSQAVTYLAGTVDPLYASKVMYGRDLGMMFFGEMFNSHFKYEIGLFNGQGVNINDKNNKKDFQLKLEYAPMPNLRFVTSGQKGKGCAADYCWLSPDAPFISPYNQKIKAGEDYQRDRWTFGTEYKTFATTPASDWKKRPFMIRGEVLGGKDGDVESFGGYFVTSIPIYSTLEAVASYDFLNYNTSEDLKSTKYIFGLQYWFFRQCRIMLQYTHNVLENMTIGEPIVIPNPQGPPTIKYNYQPDYDMIQLQFQIGF